MKMTYANLLEEEQETAAVHEPSSYLKYLPAIYSEDEFMGRFLNIFENIITPIEETIRNIHDYFDPKMTPEPLLPWLASWLDLVLDEEWPLDKRRVLIGAAVRLYQLRGTLRGLSEYLRIYTGAEPTIEEHHGGIRLGPASELGWNTILGDGQDHCFTVVLRLDEGAPVDLAKVKAIIQAEKPAHLAYILQVERRTASRHLETGAVRPGNGEQQIDSNSGGR